MTSTEFWLDAHSTTAYEPAQDDYLAFNDEGLATSINRYALDTAMEKVALAVAALQRAGPRFTQLSETFWFFAAGCWSSECYNERIGAAGDKLPARVSVHDDVGYAEGRVGEAIALLRREGDVRDATDLTDAFKKYCVEKGDW
ncbi:hypothetical protein LTR08_000297 [Meristemomyces frigidus]|nr:hypothetical protein LTR08_000297 [Meristemomyces frigidus]